MENMTTRLGLCLLVFLNLAFSIAGYSQTKKRKPAPISKCIIASDIHFDPLYGSAKDTDLKRKLITTPINGWKKIFEASPIQMTVDASLLYKDANYAVLKAALTNMKKTLPNPAFIAIAGDFIWHKATPADSVLKRKCIQFIAQLFKDNFPGVTIVPAMGNNDTYGKDYALQDTRFLNDFADAWSPNLPKASADQLKALGYYTCHAGNIDLIVFNSALLNSGTNYPQAPAMLSWLETNLADNNHKNIWTLTHIPPGMNVFNGSGFWNAGYTQTFINDIVKYSPKIGLTIASHTHLNDFRVFYTNDETPAPVAFMRIVPSICSNHGNNPSFEVAEFTATTGKIVKETNYYLDLAAIPKGKNGADMPWTETLGIPSTLNTTEDNAQGLSKFIDAVAANQSWQPLTSYTRFYTVGTFIDSAARMNRNNYKKYLKADSLKAK
jgi:hypothetical protein